MHKRILLTMSEKLYETLSQKAERNGYMTIQELINDIIRKTLFGTTANTLKLRTTNAGRPPRIDEEKILGTKKIFK